MLHLRKRNCRYFTQNVYLSDCIYICSTYERKRKKEVGLLKTRVGQVHRYEEETILKSDIWINLCGTTA